MIPDGYVPDINSGKDTIDKPNMFFLDREKLKNEILTNNEWIADWYGDPISHEQTKEKNINTSINKIEKKSTSYAEVNYDIFGILTNDYHNELYGFIDGKNNVSSKL